MRAVLLRRGVATGASDKVLNPRDDSARTHRC